MPKIEAWKCPHTAKLFEDEGDYKRHLDILSRRRRLERDRQILVASVDSVIAGEQQCQNAQELCEYILANSKEYLIRGMWHSSNGAALDQAFKRGYKIKWPKITGMKLHQVRWNNSVSNSHSAPRGKPQNFRSSNGIPNGYPGWRGNLRVWHDKDARVVITDPKSKKKKDYRIPYFSDCVSHLSGIHTGSGGGLNDGYYCDFKMFAEDFPEMEKQITFHILGGPTTKDVNWDTPAYPVLDTLGEGRIGHIVDGDPF